MADEQKQEQEQPEIDLDFAKRFGEAYDAAQDQRWFMTVYATEREQNGGDNAAALETTLAVLQEHPAPPAQ